MKVLKRTLLELMAGGFLGFLIWSLVGQRLTSWWFTSPGGSFNCQVDVLQGLSDFVAMQFYSAIAGALILAIGLVLARRALAKRRNARAAASPAPIAPGRVS